MRELNLKPMVRVNHTVQCLIFYINIIKLLFMKIQNQKRTYWRCKESEPRTYVKH
jgi:hypothetical protein